MRKSTHTPEYSVLRSVLARTRGNAGLSQRQLAAMLHVPHSWVAKVESGERRIDVVELIWFCSACNADAGLALADVFREAGVSKNPKAEGLKRKTSRSNYNKRHG